MRKQHLEEIEQHFSKFLNQLNQKTDEKESLIEELELKKEKSIEFIHGNKIDDDSSSQFKESPSKIEENGLNKDQPSKKPGKKKKIILTSKDLNNKNKMGAFAGVLKPKAKKTETKKENEEKEGNTQNQLKDEEVKEIPDRKRFIEAGIFDAEGLVFY